VTTSSVAPLCHGNRVCNTSGFRTVAIGRGREKEKLVRDLGTHVYIDTAVDDAAAERRC